MRKKVFGKQLKRDKDERKALFKGLLSSLVLEESIKTTEQKAKAIRADADKLVTKAKKEPLLAKRLLEKKIDYRAVKKMISEIAPRFNNRQGGYTRMIRLGRRFGDDATMVVLEWTEKPLPKEARPKDKEVKKVTPVKKVVKKIVKEKKKESKKEAK
ncbi:MAG TPA: 50S ribosomal protein L17 [Patescibacteria group bacterium]|nr:50S ribosomal protein L17 [Patescibacteria group bacterium]